MKFLVLLGLLLAWNGPIFAQESSARQELGASTFEDSDAPGWTLDRELRLGTGGRTNFFLQAPSSRQMAESRYDTEPVAARMGDIGGTFRLSNPNPSGRVRFEIGARGDWFFSPALRDGESSLLSWAMANEGFTSPLVDHEVWTRAELESVRGDPSTVDYRVVRRDVLTPHTYADARFIRQESRDFRMTGRRQYGDRVFVLARVAVEFDEFQQDREASVLLSSHLNTRLAYGPIIGVRWERDPTLRVRAHVYRQRFLWMNNFHRDLGEQTNDRYCEHIGIPDGVEQRVRLGMETTRSVFDRLDVSLGLVSLDYDPFSVVDDAADEPYEVDPSESDALAAGFGRDLRLVCVDGSDCRGGLASLTASVLATQELSETRVLSLHYERDVADVHYTNFVSFDALSAGLEDRFGERVSWRASLQIRLQNAVGELERRDYASRIFLRGETPLSERTTLQAQVYYDDILTTGDVLASSRVQLRDYGIRVRLSVHPPRTRGGP